MTDTVNHKIKALELANQHMGEKPADTVARANAYHAFLAGAAAAGAATGGAASNKPSAGAAGATAGAKTPAAGGPKPDANKTPAAGGPKPDANKAKPDANKTPAAGAAGNKPAAGAGTANAGAPPADTKAPGGKHTYADVVNALRQVKDKSSKEDAVAILGEDGGGAKSVRDLKPALYDAVVEACENVINADGTAGGGQVEDPTAQPERDELGC